MDELMAASSATPASGRTTPTRDGEVKQEEVEKTVTEYVDVYLLAPEEDREIELKDFTIMKPKNNKMHRIVRYYQRREISYRAVPPPPPEEKVVTSPNGTNTTTITTTHRHNGGFSNPSRNAEVFRLKRRLLKEYFASVTKDPTLLSMDDEALEARAAAAGAGHGHGHGGAGGGGFMSAARSTYRRPASPPTWSSEGSGVVPSPLAMFPKYRRLPLGDEDEVPLTLDLEPRMSWKSRIKYISSLWPEIAPVDDDEDIMNYYGLEVQIISEEERKKEQDAATAAATTAAEAEEAAAAPSTSENGEAAESAVSVETSPVKKEPTSAEEEDDVPEMTVETRSAAKMKDTEPKISPIATKQDDWVQCDKCQKWRRLPNHVNVSELPASWYCKMNRWDKRFNKCSAPEEKVVVPMKEADLIVFRERKFVQDFLQRVKRMEKAVQQYKFSDAREDTGERDVVQCVECFKKRPLIGGMDARKVAQPFVCWMNNWDELHASCSAPQGAIPSRHYEVLTGPANGGTGAGEETTSAKKSGSSSHTSGGGSAKGSSSTSTGGSKKPSHKAGASGGSSNSAKQVKRKPSDSSVVSEKSGAANSTVGSATGNNSGANVKRPKRR